MRIGRDVSLGLVLGLVVAGVCPAGEGTGRGSSVSGDLVIFHAGSLAIPFKQIAEAFGVEHPGVRTSLEAAGSRTCARKISDLNRPCDVMVSADYTVIDTLLIPRYAGWNIRFATNEMSIVFHKHSRGHKGITPENWCDVLAKKDVRFGRSDPNSDPCGYRAVLTMKLAEKHYRRPGLAERLLKKDLKFIRPKETELLALLEMREIDYIFLYRSVAEQHGLSRVILPDEVTLKNPDLFEMYASVSVEISGRKPGTTVVKKGIPMVYGVTIPRSAPNPEAASAFVRFLLDEDKGMAIMRKSGQGSVVPAPSTTFERIPASLKRFALPGKTK